MRLTAERYISLLTNFGFNRIFGNVSNKMLLIDFLNSLFDGEQVIKDVTFPDSEHEGDGHNKCKPLFDVYCENEQGEKFKIQMQSAYQTYLKYCLPFYATFPIREQAEKESEWIDQFKHVYVVAFLNYDMKEPSFANNKLTFKYVEITKFNKSLEELETNFDKWLYVLQNLPRLDCQPKCLQTEIFNRLFSEAEIDRFTKSEIRAYECSLSAYRDLKNSIDSAIEKGRKEGRAKGPKERRAKGLEEGRAEGELKRSIDIARKMKAHGMPTEEIILMTDLTAGEIDNL